MSIDKNAYLQSILDEIEKVKTRGGKAIYRINEKISKETVKYVVSYFVDKSEYCVEVRPCFKCKDWDIIITF